MRSLFLGLVTALAVSGFANQGAVAAMSDETMAQLIANDLKESGRLRDYRVGVKYKDGVAWLTGTVTSRQQKQVAELIAGNSQGVVHVVSKLGVESPQGMRPEQNFQTATASASSGRSNRQNSAARRTPAQNNMPVPYSRMGQGVQAASYGQPSYGQPAAYSPNGPGSTMGPSPAGHVPGAMGQSVSHDNPQLPGYAWPSYAASPNYAALTYPKQYSASAWPYIGPFYPYPQVPLGWRKVTLEWDDGWWFLDFKDGKHSK
jgi:hypothetical protein